MLSELQGRIALGPQIMSFLQRGLLHCAICIWESPLPEVSYTAKPVLRPPAHTVHLTAEDNTNLSKATFVLGTNIQCSSTTLNKDHLSTETTVCLGP